MADSKITALAALTAADPVNDMFPVVDVSDTSMAASGTTKRISANNILSSSPTASGALTVTGLVTAGSATITGAATVGTTFAVGTVTPDIFGRFYTRSIGFDSSGSTVLQIDGTSYGGIDLGAAGVRTFSLTSSATDANISTVTNIPLNFNVNGVTQMILNTSGNLVFGNAKGIDFSAKTPDGSGTVGSEVLNDYEEGTWSPTPSGNVNLTSVVSVSARYTKVGRLVTLSGQVTATVTSPNILTYFVLPILPFANGTVTTGAVQENGNLTVGAIQVSASNLYGFFPPASAIVSGAATFYYSVTYSV